MAPGYLPRRATRRIVVLAMTALILGGCSGPAPAPSTTAPESAPAAPPPWLHVSLDYSPRHSIGLRRLDVVTDNRGAEDITVTRVGLLTDHFDDLPPEEKNSTVRAGSTVNVKAFFGPVADCAGGGPMDVAVLIEFRTADSGELHGYEIPVDPETVDEIHRGECAEKAVHDAVEFRFSDEWTTDDAVVTTSLLVRRHTGNDPVRVVDVRGMTLFSAVPMLPEGDGMAVLDPAQESLEVPVRVEVWRCEEHVVSQAPDGFAFRAVIAIGDGEPRAMRLEPEGDLRAELQHLIDRCIEETRDPS